MNVKSEHLRYSEPSSEEHNQRIAVSGLLANLFYKPTDFLNSKSPVSKRNHPRLLLSK